MATNTRDLWAKRVERWKDSGLTTKEFAAEMGINPQTLAYWRWRLKAEEAEKPGKKGGRKKPAPVEEPAPPVSFVELVPASLPSAPPAAIDASEPFEVVLRDGLRVRVPPSFRDDAVRRLVVTLEAR